MKKALAGTLLAILTLLFTTALGLAVIHITNFPYIVDVDLLNISESSGLPRGEIIENYRAIMNYLSPFSENAFSLSSLAHSPRADFHFAEVKALFNKLYISGAAAAIILTILAAMKVVSKRTLRISGTVTLLVPAFLTAAALINFDISFDIFHELFFNSETWLFDSQTDKFISILPSTFFMHCGFFIALFWLSAAILQLLIGYSERKARSI